MGRYERLSENDDLWKILSIDHSKTYYYLKEKWLMNLVKIFLWTGQFFADGFMSLKVHQKIEFLRRYS